MTYTLEEAQQHFLEILEKISAGHRVVIQENGQDIAEIMPLNSPAYSDPTEQALFELERQGIISMSKAPREELAPLVEKPGALERFLESRR